MVVEKRTAAATIPWTVASWLTSPNLDLDDLAPHEALRRGRRWQFAQAAPDFAAALQR